MWYFCNSDFLDPKDISDMELNQQQEIKNTQRTYNTLVLCELRIRFEGPKRVSLVKNRLFTC